MGQHYHELRLLFSCTLGSFFFSLHLPSTTAQPAVAYFPSVCTVSTNHTHLQPDANAPTQPVIATASCPSIYVLLSLSSPFPLSLDFLYSLVFTPSSFQTFPLFNFTLQITPHWPNHTAATHVLYSLLPS
jgi:hypothetical protein